MSGKSFQIFDFESEVGEIAAEGYRAAGRKRADLDQFVAVGCLQEHQFRTARGLVTFDLLQAQDVLVEIDRFFQIVHAVACVKKFGDHGKKWMCGHTAARRHRRQQGDCTDCDTFARPWSPKRGMAENAYARFFIAARSLPCH